MQRVLIANRGEIAIRIAHAAAALGIEAVTIAPAADAAALHTTAGTSHSTLPPSSDPVAAYLDIDAVVQAGVDSGCDAVHPGYGFLAENAEFARRCAQAGMTFIGPSPEALELFGNKVHARELATRLDIPIVPGTAAAVSTADDAVTAAEAIGYPIMLKAAAGGGGRGIRAVTTADELPAAFERCQSEALGSFGDGSVFLERLVVDPRHIEVQVMADNTGHVVHFFERDCSIQIRNQKVVEVAPAPNLKPELRSRILADAITLVSGADYRNAGTVEFLVEPSTGEYFFIECNPRIQVEHTITEQIMGVDLVQTQFRVAMGRRTLEALNMGDQGAIGEPRGWALQARVVATGTGTITRLPGTVGSRRARRWQRLCRLDSASAVRSPDGQGDRVDPKRNIRRRSGSCSPGSAAISHCWREHKSRPTRRDPGP